MRGRLFSVAAWRLWCCGCLATTSFMALRGSGGIGLRSWRTLHVMMFLSSFQRTLWRTLTHRTVGTSTPMYLYLQLPISTGTNGF